MTLAIRMPELAPGGAGTTLVKWFVGVGSRVEIGDVIAEVESDKAVVELEAETGGVVDRIVVAEGTSDVAPDQVLAVLAGDQTAGAGAEGNGGESAGATPDANAGEPPVRPSKQAESSALARHLSLQAGMEVTDIAGSGPGGRVLARDVLAALGPTGSNGGESRAGVAGPEFGTAQGGEVSLLDNARKIVARRLSQSKREAPHYYMSKACDVEALLELRAVLNRDLAPDLALSLNDLLVKIVAETLRRRPELNAAWDESGIRRFDAVDLCVAVAGPRGLVAPVVRGAERKSLADIAAQLRDLISRARAGALSPQELAGGTFTLSNLGMHGVASFAGIINPPQAAILAVGAAEPTPVVVAGVVRSRRRMTCTLSVDHRVADGLAGAEFLAELSRLVEDPRRLVL